MTKKKKYLLTIIISSAILVIFYLLTINKVIEFEIENNDRLTLIFCLIIGFICLCCWRYGKICPLCGEGTEKETHYRKPIDGYIDGTKKPWTYHVIYDVKYECDRCGYITHKLKRQREKKSTAYDKIDKTVWKRSKKCETSWEEPESIDISSE